MNRLTRCTLPVLVLLASYQLHAQVTSDRIRRAAAEPRNWLTYGGTYTSQRYSLLNQITPANVGRGQAIYNGKGGCAACHRVDGVGPRVAPDLSEIGAVRTPAALQRSLVDPTSAMLPINRPVRAVTRDGRTIRGRRLNEDTFTVQLIDEQERLVSLMKADLREYELAKVSPMPSVAGKLTADEQADLVAYLLSLKGPR